jgi:NADH-quinone oxidoreductase subunit F
MEQPLTKDIDLTKEPPDRATYQRSGGYQALRWALKTMSPQDVQEEVLTSGLRGRGGAGFPTGKKWSFVPMGDDAPKTKYLVANADEMEAGTFKDRHLMEGNPHLLIEGMILAAYAVQAPVAYIFLRWAYKRSAQQLRRAIAEAYDAGYLGKNILGSGFDLDIYLHLSAGRYMCGEETGLLNSLEGRRAIPRAKPPYPPVVGAFGKPTVVNNVETLCNVAPIILNGAHWFHGLSRTNDGGTKLYGISGKVRRPGLWELPLGTTMREILEERAGGMREGLTFRAALPGGASTGFLMPEHLDVKLDFNGMDQTGTRLGTGAAIVLDDRTCPVGMILNLMHYFAQESCGWCTPCREGLPWTEKMLQAIESGDGRLEDLDRLDHHAKYLDSGFTFCALAPGAAGPLKTGLMYFRDEFERHIREKRCPWRS